MVTVLQEVSSETSCRTAVAASQPRCAYDTIAGGVDKTTFRSASRESDSEVASVTSWRGYQSASWSFLHARWRRPRENIPGRRQTLIRIRWWRAEAQRRPPTPSMKQRQTSSTSRASPRRRRAAGRSVCFGQAEAPVNQRKRRKGRALLESRQAPCVNKVVQIQNGGWTVVGTKVFFSDKRVKIENIRWSNN